jgi:hypothetical protein
MDQLSQDQRFASKKSQKARRWPAPRLEQMESRLTTNLLINPLLGCLDPVAMSLSREQFQDDPGVRSDNSNAVEIVLWDENTQNPALVTLFRWLSKPQIPAGMR